MLKATANIAIKTCHFPKLAPAPPLLVWGEGEWRGDGIGGFGGGLPTSSCFLKLLPGASICSEGLRVPSRTVPGTGKNRAGEAGGKKPFPHGADILGEKGNSMYGREEHTEQGRWVKGLKRKHREELLAGQSHRFQEGLNMLDEEVCCQGGPPGFGITGLC